MRAINIPSLVKIESGITQDIFSYLNRQTLNLNKILLVSGEGPTIQYASIIEKKLNKSYNIENIKIQSNTMKTVLLMNEKILLEGFTIIIGVGGGKVLDVCKYVAYISRIDFIAIPTSLAHDGIASPIAVIKVGNQVKSLGCNIPKLVLVDLDIIMKSPVMTRKAGIGDILSNYTAIYDWKLANENGESEIDDFALMLSNMAYSSVVNHTEKDVENVDFIKTLAQAVIISGLAMEISGDSRPCSGSEHLFSHALDTLDKPIKLPHGIQVAIGSVMAAYIQGQDYMKQIAFLKDFKLPYKPSMCGLEDEIVIKAWRNAKSTRLGRYTILDIVDSDSDEFFKQILNNINEIDMECRI